MYELAKNVKIEFIPSKKFKEITYMFKFVKNYNPNDALADICLTELIGEYSKLYPTKSSMAKIKNNLYGNRVGATRQISTDYETISFYYHFINPKYAKDMSFKDQCEYIKETLLNPLFNDDLISEFKRLYTDKILRRFENPGAILKENVLSLIGCQNHLSYLLSDHRDLIAGLNLDSLKAAYNKMLNESTIYIYVIGDFDSSILLKYFKQLSFKDRNLTEIKSQKVLIDNLGFHVDCKDFSQSYLNVVYQCDYSNADQDYYKWLVTDAFLGMIPNSLLFKEIREKRSLCYSISSQLYKPDGLSIISVAFSYKDYDEIIKLIEECINKLANGNFDLKDFDAAKTYIANIMLSNEDDAKTYVNYLHSRNILKSKLSIREVAELIADVKPQDVSAVAKTYQQRLIYVLRGKQDGIN